MLLSARPRTAAAAALFASLLAACGGPDGAPVDRRAARDPDALPDTRVREGLRTIRYRYVTTRVPTSAFADAPRLAAPLPVHDLPGTVFFPEAIAATGTAEVLGRPGLAAPLAGGGTVTLHRVRFGGHDFVLASGFDRPAALAWETNAVARDLAALATVNTGCRAAARPVYDVAGPGGAPGKALPLRC